VRPLPILLSLLLGLPSAARALEGLPVLLRCGEQEVEITPRGGGLHLLAGFERHELVAVPAASGARFEKPGDPGTSFWSRGERGTLVLAGTELPECAPKGPFSAGGNEPFWRVRVDAETLLLDRLGEPPLTAPKPQAAIAEGALTWTAEASGRPIAVRIRPEICRDSMTGMPYPARVAVSFDGRTLEGCGGDPGAVLRRREWRVTSLDGAPLAALRGTVTLAFGTGGRFAGQGPCNRLLGSYRLSGEELRLGPVASTMMACPEPIMEAEQALTRALEAVRRFEPASGEGLVLLTDAPARIALAP
jgi:uncharacterized membrane protein